MQTLVRFFNRQGAPLGEPYQPLVTRAWMLNEPGTTSFFVPVTDAAYDADMLAYGNLVVIDHDRLPSWAGVLWPAPQRWEWSTGGVNIRAIGAESILKRRVSRVDAGRVSIGAGVEAMLADLNAVEDTLLRAGEIFYGGKPRNADWRYRWPYDVLKNWTNKGLIDWGIEPVVDATTGLLTLNTNIYERRGEAFDVALVEGVNLKWLPGMPAMIEQGDIYNEVTVFEREVHNNVRNAAVADNQTSRAAYGLSQMAVVGQPDLEAQAQATLTKQLGPRRMFPAEVIDENSAFDYLQLGNTLWLDRPTVHFDGIRARVRIMGIAFADADGRAVVTLQEVTG